MPLVEPLAQVPAIAEAVARLRAHFDSGATRPLAWRKEQLERLIAMIEENEPALLDALARDLGRPAFEGWISETHYVAGEARYALAHLRRWMKPRRARTPLMVKPAAARIHAEPLGVVCILSPWNYPVQLALAPLVGALAAGNTVVLKPSELAPHTSRTLAELVGRAFDPAVVTVIEGGVAETTALLAERFDHLFYTGSAKVGRIVMAAATRHLTPVTLELGGKSPCIVDAGVDLEVAARRIAWAKFFNAGQTCVAPDYLLVPPAAVEPLILALRAAVRGFYGDDPQESPDYGRIAHARHHARLVGLLASGTIAFGGEHDTASRYFAPTVLTGVAPDSPVMAEEIFGPILPIVTVENLDQSIAFVNGREKPLALYLFSRDRSAVERVLSRTSSGGVCVNDTVWHLVPPELPFGGVGASGMGAYHGKQSFDTFTHEKSVLTRSTFPDPAIRYPPYTDQKQKWARRLL